ncbi:MAG: alginate export family protein [Candidatus Jettenia sp.]|nr:MAG: alginate export family protein [Candidatus Jettenia sp.]
MIKKIPCILVMIFVFPPFTFSETFCNISPNLKLSIKNHLRFSGNSIGNNLDLDSKKSDGVTYVGYTYDTEFNITYKDFLISFIRFESSGPFDYDAPIISDKKINTLFGEVDNYSVPEIIPRVEEYWIDSLIFHLPARLKLGQYAYHVGNGYALGGYYENCGFSAYSMSEDFKWTFSYVKPDVVNKIILGPQVPQERSLDVEYDSNAHFVSFDVLMKRDNGLLQPYIGLLHDTTPSNRRVSTIPVPVNEDNLFTIGIDTEIYFDTLHVGFEVAKNFGSANVLDDQDDIIHKGYMAYADISYNFEKFTPRSKLLVSSGNKMDADDVVQGRFNSHSNNVFSVYSPTNINLSDTIYPAAYGPFVATGGSYGLNYGIVRPGTFGDPYQLNNLILPNIGIDIQITDTWLLSLDYWYLRSFEHAIGILNNRAITLSSDLGHELDFYSSYDLTDHISFSLQTGIFFPGRYYHEKRNDGDILGLAPAPRFDGDADPAYQIELVTEIIF